MYFKSLRPAKAGLPLQRRREALQGKEWIEVHQSFDPVCTIWLEMFQLMTLTVDDPEDAALACQLHGEARLAQVRIEEDLEALKKLGNEAKIVLT